MQNLWFAGKLEPSADARRHAREVAHAAFPKLARLWFPRWYFVHEMGHALGFNHEHQRPDRTTVDESGIPTCDLDLENGSENVIAAGEGVLFGPYDVHSVMNYCARWEHTRAPFNQLMLSKWDRKAIRYFYGAPRGCQLGATMRNGVRCTCADADGEATVALPESRKCELPT